MFTNSLIVLEQLIVMFLLIVIGYFLFRKNVFTNETTQSITVLLNKYVIFFVLLRSFQRPFDAHLGYSLAVTFLGCAAVYLLSILLANRLFRPAAGSNYADRRSTAVLSNCGFMALPLLDAMYGSDGVFLGAANIACMTIALWTYSVRQFSGGKQALGIRNILVNPALLATACGVLLFCSPAQLPALVYRAVDFMGDLNTPLAMLVLGCFLAQVDLRRCFTDPAVWRVAAVRLVLIPAVTIALLLVLPLDHMSKVVLLTGSAAPCALASAMFGQLYGTDYLFSTRVIALSTLLSVVTLPLSISALEGLLFLLG